MHYEFPQHLADLRDDPQAWKTFQAQMFELILDKLKAATDKGDVTFLLGVVRGRLDSCIEHGTLTHEEANAAAKRLEREVEQAYEAGTAPKSH